MANETLDLKPESALPPINYDVLDLPDSAATVGNLPRDISLDASPDEQISTPQGSERQLPTWLTASLSMPTSSVDEVDDPSAIEAWDLGSSSDDLKQPASLSQADWQFLRTVYDSQPAEAHTGVLDAQIISETVNIAGEVNHVVSALEIYEDHAQQLVLAEYRDATLAKDFYFGLQDATQDLPIGQRSDFAQFASSSHAEWTAIDLAHAPELIDADRALNQDVTRASDSITRAVIAEAPAIRYETLMTPHFQDSDTTYQVLVAQRVADKHPGGTDTVNYAPVGDYPTSREANAVINGLEQMRRQVGELVGEEDIRADQALVSTAHMIAVGNGLVADHERLFPNGSDPRFDERITPMELVQQIETDLIRNAVEVATEEHEVPQLSSLGIEM